MCYVHNQWYDISCTTLYIACIVTFLFVSILPHCTNEYHYKIFKLRALRTSNCCCMMEHPTSM